MLFLSQNTGSLRSVKGRGAAVYRFQTCVRTIPCGPAGACLCFSVEVFLDVKFWQGRPQPLVDVAAHGAEPDVRHVQDRVSHLAPRLLNRVEVGTAGRRATARRDLRVFSRCVPYCRTRPALAVPCFFAAGCPRRVCRNPYGIFGLFWILLPVLTCTVQPVGHFHQHMQT